MREQLPSQYGLQVLTEAPTILVVGYDEKGLITGYNSFAEKVFGYSQEEALGHAVLELFPGQTLESLAISRSLHGRRKDGTLFVTEPMTFQSGSSRIMFFRDHSERLRMEKELRLGKAFAQLLQEVAVAANEAHSFDDALKSALLSVCKYTECSVGHVFRTNEANPSELLSTNIWHFADSRFEFFREIVSGRPLSWGVGFSGRALATGKPVYGAVSEHSGHGPDLTRQMDHVGLCGGWAIPIIWHDKVVAVISGMSRTPMESPDHVHELSDFINSQMARVLERKAAEEQLIRAREAAIEASSSKSRFLANMSHELRTPLNALTGMAHLLTRTQLDEEQTEYARTMVRSADALLTLINDVLDFSKIEAGKLDLRVTDFHLDSLFRDTTSLLAYDAQRKGISFISSVDSDVPLSIRGDAGRLRQVLVNLIGNAIKFTERGKVAVRIHRGEHRSDGRTKIRFEVVDTGIGIPEEARGRIFQVFSQVDSSSTRRHAGTGLGLSICRRLVELMGGEIGFETQVGKGSTFWFEVPFERSAIDVRERNASASRKPTERAARTCRVLVAEDNAVSQRMVVKMLEKQGFEASAVDTGTAAVAAVREGEFDVVLMDCQMPEMDGYEATARIRELANGKDIQIIAMTANALKGDRERCLAAGMDQYIAKPFDPERLMATIEGSLDRSEPVAAVQRKRTARPVVDLEALAKLRKLNVPGEQDVASELAAIFFETAPKRLQRIQQALLESDSDTVAREAHHLTSASASLGAVSLRELCSELDALGRANELGRAQPVAERLRGEYDDFVRQLRSALTES